MELESFDGVRLHYIDRGQGEPVVLLHGNGTMAQDFDLSGVLEIAAGRYRVIAFDRPGYGHSARPRDRIWTPDAQAKLLITADGWRTVFLINLTVVAAALVAVPLLVAPGGRARTVTWIHPGWCWPRSRWAPPCSP